MLHALHLGRQDQVRINTYVCLWVHPYVRAQLAMYMRAHINEYLSANLYLVITDCPHG